MHVLVHTPPEQASWLTFVVLQARLQAPQLLRLVAVLTHEPPQSVSPGPQFDTQFPPEQTSPLPQAWPHWPQLAWSEARATQTPPQSECSEGQPHLPPLQVWPVGQAWPQVPQLCGSVARCTQWPLQFVSPLGQTRVQRPLEHTCPLEQR